MSWLAFAAKLLRNVCAIIVIAIKIVIVNVVVVVILIVIPKSAGLLSRKIHSTACEYQTLGWRLRLLVDFIGREEFAVSLST
jgi:hypothetical protein